MSAGIVAEFHQRLAAMETSVRDLHDKVDAAVQSGALEPELLEKVAHVMRKYFPHDMAEKEPEAPRVPRYDPYTGHPLN